MSDVYEPEVSRASGNEGPLHIVFAASETLPFQKTGGLADVTASLPKELARMGHRVEIFIPLYLKALLYPIDHGLPIRPAEGFPLVKIRLAEFSFRSRIYTTTLPDAPVRVHLVDSETYQYFTSRSALVSPYSFNDNTSRFSFFSKVVAKVCAYRPDRPDIVHAHDWPTGFVPMFLTTDYEYTKIATVFTIHNLGYTNDMSPSRFHELTRLEDADHPGLYDWKGRGIQHEGRIDMLKSGIVRSDMVNTVSPTYALEIQDPRYGGSYAPTLRWIAQRGQLEGILNGLDGMWHPTLPPEEFLEHKQASKRELQRAFSLPVDDDAFLVVMTSRLAQQKGYQLLPETVGLLRSRGVSFQLVAAVDGEESLRQAFLSCDSPEIPVRHMHYNEDLTRSLIYPGADCLLMPSLYEPCGLSQIIAQINGAPPVVFATGGLKDTVQDGETGFVFAQHEPGAFADAVERAWRTYRHDRPAWEAMRRRMLDLDYSWHHSALSYLQLYRRALARAGSINRFG